MLDKLNRLEEKLRMIEQSLADPSVINDRRNFMKISKEHAEIAPVVEKIRIYKQMCEELEDNKSLLEDSDSDIRELAKEEIVNIEDQIQGIENELKILLLPKDVNDDKNVIFEIRAGTGGDEAALFVADLFRMYSYFAEKKSWKIEVMSSNITGVGGFKEIIFLITGKGAFSELKHESGAHRVQRVPETESQGRIHTSAVTVAVLPEAEEVDVEIDPTELRIDVYRSSGPGGQHVNKTESAVRITHLPTNVVVQCQDEKSQMKNKAKAMKVLLSRLLDKKLTDQKNQISHDRKIQVGSGDRSERIRTYNFPQGRVTDHRIGLTLYKLESIMQGDIQEIIDKLNTHFQTLALSSLN